MYRTLLFREQGIPYLEAIFSFLTRDTLHLLTIFYFGRKSFGLTTIRILSLRDSLYPIGSCLKIIKHV